MPPMRKDEDVGCDSDGESFEVVTPEHIYENPNVGVTPISVNEKCSHILEDVDGELDMEDVAPSCEAELISVSNHRVNTVEISHQQFEQNLDLPFAPPLPKDVPPSYPPLPTSPPPPPPLPQSAVPEPTTSVLHSTTSIHTTKVNKQLFIGQQPVAPRNPLISDAVHYHAPEIRDIQMPIPESVTSCSFSSLPVSHPPIRAVSSECSASRWCHLAQQGISFKTTSSCSVKSVFLCASRSAFADEDVDPTPSLS